MFHGQREDASGAVLETAARDAGLRGGRPHASSRTRPTPIGAAVTGLCDAETALVLVTGGTGFAPRDVTPEALRPLYDRLVPGIDEAMRAASMAVKPHGMLTRGVSGIRGTTLVLSFPGSPRACAENFAVVEPVLDHALKLLRQAPTEHL